MALVPREWAACIQQPQGLWTHSHGTDAQSEKHASSSARDCGDTLGVLMSCICAMNTATPGAQATVNVDNPIKVLGVSHISKHACLTSTQELKAFSQQHRCLVSMHGVQTA